MAQLVDIQKVTVTPRNLVAQVRIADGAPLYTSEDVEATARVYWLMPAIAQHACLGDAGELFQDAMGDTELAHLLEHVAVELMAKTGMAGDVACGRTRALDVERTFEVELACPDDVLAAAALSSAAFILEWAYSGADPEQHPDIDAIVEGIQSLTAASYSMPGDESGQEAPAPAPEPVQVEAPEAVPADDAAPADDAPEPEEPASDDEPEAPADEPEPAAEEPAGAPAGDADKPAAPEPAAKQRPNLDFDGPVMPANRHI